MGAGGDPFLLYTLYSGSIPVSFHFGILALPAFPTGLKLDEGSESCGGLIWRRPLECAGSGFFSLLAAIPRRAFGPFFFYVMLFQESDDWIFENLLPSS